MNFQELSLTEDSSCCTCLFWSPTIRPKDRQDSYYYEWEPGDGLCHKTQPKAKFKTGIAEFPIINASDFCNAFQKSKKSRTYIRGIKSEPDLTKLDLDKVLSSV